MVEAVKKETQGSELMLRSYGGMTVIMSYLSPVE